MKVIDPGHVYELQWLDGEPEVAELNDPEQEVSRPFRTNTLQFVKREGPGYPGNVYHHPGTTIQEVLRALIDRVKYLNNQIPDKRNDGVILQLQCAIWLLEDRAAQRHGRDFSKITPYKIENRPTCSKCLHIGCNGQCHPDQR